MLLLTCRFIDPQHSLLRVDFFTLFFFLQKGNYARAVANYKKIITYLQYETGLKADEAKERDQLLLAAHLNIAMCNLKLQNFCDVGFW